MTIWRDDSNRAETRQVTTATLRASANWRSRLLAHQVRRLPQGAPPEQLELLLTGRALLEVIEHRFEISADGILALSPERSEVHALHERMHAAERAVRRAYAAGLECDAIQRVNQSSWSLACRLFEAIGWAEAFRIRPGTFRSARRVAAGQRTKPGGNRGGAHLHLVPRSEGGPLPPAFTHADPRRGVL